MSALTPLVSRADSGLLPPRRVTPNPAMEMGTLHYMGASPWAGADRSSPTAFAATTDHARCATLLCAVQAYHYRPGTNAADIFYSSAYCPHGYRFECRGPGVLTGANGTPDGNRRSYALLYIAGDADPLTDGAMLAIADEEARYGLPVMRDHSQWKPTSCGGAPQRAWLAAGKPAPWVPPPPATDDPEEGAVLELVYDTQTYQCWFHHGGGLYTEATTAEHVYGFTTDPAKVWQGRFVPSHAMRYIVADAQAARAAEVEAAAGGDA